MQAANLYGCGRANFTPSFTCFSALKVQTAGRHLALSFSLGYRLQVNQQKIHPAHGGLDFIGLLFTAAGLNESMYVLAWHYVFEAEVDSATRASSLPLGLNSGHFRLGSVVDKPPLEYALMTPKQEYSQCLFASNLSKTYHIGSHLHSSRSSHVAQLHYGSAFT